MSGKKKAAGREEKSAARRRKIWGGAKITLATLIAAAFAILFLMPIVLTITNSFMGSSEISSNYGSVFATTDTGGKVYISEKVNLKFIPDMVSFSQYITVLFKSPEYLLKFWNSVILVGPIVVFQLIVATLAAYGFARYEGRLRQIIFFSYIILMLMPYQVTLVPNYLVSDWLNILDTYWAIWLPGIFSPFAVYLLTKFVRRIPADLPEDLYAAVQRGHLFRGDPGVYRLLEHGGAAADPFVGRRDPSPVGILKQDQRRRDRPCFRGGDHLHGALPADLPLRRGISGGWDHLSGRHQGVKDIAGKQHTFIYEENVK